MRKRVFITGIGAATPLGCGVERFWQRLCAGESGVRRLDGVPALEGHESHLHVGAPIADFEPAEHFTTKELQRLSRSAQIALVAAKEAMAMAGMDAARDRDLLQGTAVILGSSITSISSSETFFYKYLETGRADPLTIPASMNLAPAAGISLRWGCRGPMFTVDGACASSNHAIGMALLLVQSGAIDCAVTGGAESPFAPAVLAAWASMHMLSDSIEPPAQACRPFSRDRAGMVLGEHGAIVVIESEDSARRRGATVLAELRGYGATSDGFHMTEPSPDGRARAMESALRDAGLTAGDVDYVSAHGTGTAINDKVETEAIKRALGERAAHIPVVSIKGAVGHSLAASAALELVSCVLSLRDSRVPPTINLRQADPECDLDYVSGASRAAVIRHAMSNAFGFGGSNAAVIVSRFAS
jgi:3-oxoacyl-(acyl-carrier-protein) synthase